MEKCLIKIGKFFGGSKPIDFLLARRKREPIHLLYLVKSFVKFYFGLVFLNRIQPAKIRQNPIDQFTLLIKRSRKRLGVCGYVGLFSPLLVLKNKSFFLQIMEDIIAIRTRNAGTSGNGRRR